MNAQSKEKLRKLIARRKERKFKQYAVLVLGQGINPLEFVDEAELRVRQGRIEMYR